VVVVIGLAGAAFNRNTESELGLHGKMSIGPYTLECTGFTQDSNLNYNSEYALLDVYKDGKKQFQMTPEKRVYLITGQPQTMVAIHSTLSWICTLCTKAPTRHRAADHQGNSQPACWVDLGGPGSAGDWHAAGAGSKHKPSNRGTARTGANGAYRACNEGRPPVSVRTLLTFWTRTLQVGAVAVAVCFSLGATDAGSRYTDLNHRLMCTCGCAQVLGECNHVGCPNSAGELNELRVAIANNQGDQPILDGFVARYGAVVLAAPTATGSMWWHGSHRSQFSVLPCWAQFCWCGAGRLPDSPDSRTGRGDRS